MQSRLPAVSKQAGRQAGRQEANREADKAHLSALACLWTTNKPQGRKEQPKALEWYNDSLHASHVVPAMYLAVLPTL